MARTRFVEVINRTTQPLDVMFDGVPDVIPPGYVIVQAKDPDGKPLEKAGKPVMKVVGAMPDGSPRTFTGEIHAVEAWKRQHPLMGSQDPESVDARDTDYLLGVEEWGDEISHLEQSDAIELIDRSLLPEDRQNIAVRQVAGGRRKVDPNAPKKRKRELVARNKRRVAYTDNKLKNPVGMRVGYDD